ncbi:MAG TPA: nitroreductase family protein [bacterium]|nr:nitroreductase family protein [bacterium]HQG45736.1 nitroreductase family protein [bacterium]HQI49524.1 nitroreductase family protein [bacterium]HQJ63656.1 nitroreductase family protein [bacterium]
MEFQQVIQSRYSVRAYKADPVESEKLERVLQAANLAPTACNRQPFQLFVLETRGREAELGRIYSRPWFVQAPLVLAIVALPDEAWSRRDGANYALVDAAIAFDHLILAATDLGLGTCWIAAFDPQAARAVLQLPESAVPVAFTPLGYPADSPGAKHRKKLTELVRRGG